MGLQIVVKNGEIQDNIPQTIYTYIPRLNLITYTDKDQLFVCQLWDLITGWLIMGLLTPGQVAILSNNS